MFDHHCPHCQTRLASTEDKTYPPAGLRCATCRLVVGIGRAVPPGSAASTTGSAAGVIASAARRAGGATEAVDPEKAIDALRTVAATLEVPEGRLRMLDYDAAHQRGVVDVSLAQVLATFGTWKAARADLDPTAEDDLL